MRKILGFLGKVVRWYFVLFFLILMLAGGPSAIFFGLTALMIAPVGKLKHLKEKLKISKKANVGLAAALFMIGAMLVSPAENDPVTQDAIQKTIEELPEEVNHAEEDAAVEELPVLEEENVIQEDSTFAIRFLDVGQADAALIECDSHYMLIDGGNKEDSDKMYAILKESGIDHLDIIVGTHADEDHIGGLAGTLNYADADLVLCSVAEHDTEAFHDFAKYAEQNGGGIAIPEIGDEYSLGSSIITILGINAGSETNDASIILKIEYGETSFVFTGDAETIAEQEVINSGLDISADVLKIGHHGSADSTSEEFLDRIMPDYAIISVGSENTYLHPADETLGRLESAGIEVFRTDLQGEILVTSDRKTVTVTTEKEASKEEIFVSGEEAAAKAEAEAKAQAEAEAKAKAETENQKKTSYTYSSLNKTMYAAQSVNIRSLPNAESEKLGGLSYAEEVIVTGQCDENGWYRIEYNGSEAYVSNQYLTDDKPVKQNTSSGERDENTGVATPAGTDYVLNTNTGKFHYPSCRSVKQMKDKNKAFYNGTRDEVIAKGYDPCGNCHP